MMKKSTDGSRPPISITMNASQRPACDRATAVEYGWHGAFLSGGNDGILSSRRDRQCHKAAAVKDGEDDATIRQDITQRSDVDPAASPEAIAAAYPPQGAHAASGRPGYRRRRGFHADAGRPTTCWATPIAAPPTTARASRPRRAGRRSPSRSPRRSAPVGSAGRAVGRLRRACSVWRRSWRVQVDRPAPPPAGRPAVRATGRRSPPQRGPRRRSSACRQRRRPPTTCVPGGGDAVLWRARWRPRRLLCRRATSPPSARSARCAWYRSMAWWRSASPTAAPASLTRPG